MATRLSTNEMKESVQRHFAEFVNANHPEVIRKNMTHDFLDHDGPGGKPAGVEEDEKMMLAMHRMMPGIKVTIEEMVAEGDRVVCRNVWRWKEARTGHEMEFHGFVEWRFEGDQIAERWATVTEPRRA